MCDDKKTDKPVFVAFEGGGAKGIAHIGALEAIEEVTSNICGVSGTSAGALVAALCSAGFKAKEIIDDNGNPIIFDSIKKQESDFNVPDFIGIYQWKRLQLFRLIRKLLNNKIAPPAVFAMYLLIVYFLITHFTEDTTLYAFYNGIAILLFVFIIFALYIKFIIVSLRIFRENLHSLLINKARESECDDLDEITFGNIESLGWKPLKIVASNLTTRKMELFSKETTPDINIADAVTASICIPFLFKPWIIDRKMYVDGGMLSNLPAWVFEEERSLQPDTYLITVEFIDNLAKHTSQQVENNDSQNNTLSIHENELSHDKKGFSIVRKFNDFKNSCGWLKSLVHTAVFGADNLSKQVQGEVIAISTNVYKDENTELELLDFDLSKQQALYVKEQTKNAALLKLEHYFINYNKVNTLLLEKIHSLVFKSIKDEVLARSDLFLTNQKDLNSSRRIRISIANKPNPNSITWKTCFHYNFKSEDPDYCMNIPDSCSFVGEVARNNQMDIADISSLRKISNSNTNPLAVNLERKCWKNLKWIFALPLTGCSNEMKTVLIIDSDIEINISSKRLIQWSNEIFDTIKEPIQTLEKYFSERNSTNGKK